MAIPAATITAKQIRSSKRPQSGSPARARSFSAAAFRSLLAGTSLRAVLDFMGLFAHPVFSQDLFPLPLSFQDDFHHLADRAAAARRFRHQMDHALHFGTGVDRSGGEAHPGKNRRIGEVIADVADFLVADARLA